MLDFKKGIKKGDLLKHQHDKVIAVAMSDEYKNVSGWHLDIVLEGKFFKNWTNAFWDKLEKDTE